MRVLKSIQVTNERALEILAIVEGVQVNIVDHLGETESSFEVKDRDIVMLLNLYRYLKEKGETTVYIKDESIKCNCPEKEDFDNLVQNKYLLDYLLLSN